MQGYLEHYFFRLWEVVVDHGLPLTGLLLTAILVPRVGRMAVRIIESRLDEKEESTKARLALAGALIYVFQAVAYFLIIIAALSNIGVPPLGAAIPATVISAAVGFGAQSIIGDFLAGFFILSEKQFGVGDYVSFDGVAGIEGTVVSLTLRTTKVRTPTGEVVMVPNGSAGVVTNFSQDWSRAVVDIEIPVHEGETLPDISNRVKRISLEALHDAAIASDVVGELEVLPATGIVAPTVAGQPWQVKYRVLVEVNPARQWAVERAIRSALITAFWDHYNLSTDISGFGQAAAPHALLGDVPSAPPHTHTEASNTESNTGASDTGAAEVSALAEDAVAGTAAADTAADTEADTDAAETEVFAAPARKEPEAAENAEEAGETEQFERAAVTGKDDGPGKPADSAVAAESEQEDEEDTTRGIWRADTPESKWDAFWTMGGRVRASTTGLFAGLGAVILLILASANPDGVDAGWLSPAHWSKAPGAPSSEAPSHQASAEPSAPATDAPEETAPAEPTATTEPTGTEAPDSAGQNGGGEATTTERRDRHDRDDWRSTETEDAGSTPTQNAPGSTQEPQEPTGQATAGQVVPQDAG
ncbi:mechanosensitive ion channel family protein [Corynebacterium sp.]|uniref:mechanosensitive ion channel family protein n=1 Tax=Corynebacterium sp. TaxID=1720 RepID=UPI0026DD3471|nr:mechanosensitive ion channel domain-containing protein [Corynebacterium sp.]MDO5031305.1 mechanosensitive ion channel [Corynebacterium sp.]